MWDACSALMDHVKAVVAIQLLDRIVLYIPGAAKHLPGPCVRCAVGVLYLTVVT